MKGSEIGGLNPKKREKNKKRERGIFVISRDKYEGRGVFFAFFPKPHPQPHLTHREREREEEEKKNEEEEEIKVFDFAINSR